MLAPRDLQRRIHDSVNTYAPTLVDILMNEQATVAWEACARRDPTGVEAYGLADILAVRHKLQYLYWCNTLARNACDEAGIC
jgi:hypothetical protein